jgi:hypothetical protein
MLHDDDEKAISPFHHRTFEHVFPSKILSDLAISCLHASFAISARSCRPSDTIKSYLRHHLSSHEPTDDFHGEIPDSVDSARR